MKTIDKGKDFIFIIPLNIEISWWKRNYMGSFIIPALSICKSGNTKGIKLHFLTYTVDISYYFKLSHDKPGSNT